MDSGIWVTVSLPLSLVFAVGPLAALIVLFVLLNRRDRRQEQLLSLVALQFSGEILRSDVVIGAHCPLLLGSAVIRVDIRHDGGEVWPAIERLGRALPPRVPLVVTGAPPSDRRSHMLPDAVPAQAPAPALEIAGGFASWEAPRKNGVTGAAGVSMPRV